MNVGVGLRAASAALATVLIASCSGVTAVPRSGGASASDGLRSRPHDVPLAYVGVTVAWGTGMSSVGISASGHRAQFIDAPATQKTMLIPVGVQTLTIVTWSGADGTGKALGQVHLPSTISATAANSLNLAGSGNATTMTVYTPSNESPALLLGSVATGYTMVQYQALLGVYFGDSTGRTLLIAPQTLTSNLSTRELWVKYADKLRSEIALDAPQYDIAPTTLTLGAVNADASTVSTSFPFKRVWPMVVIDARPPFVQMFDRDGNALPLLPGAFSGLQKPTSVTWSRRCAEYAISDAGTNSIHFYGLDGSTSPRYHGKFAGISDPVGLWYNEPAGDLSVANAGTQTIDTYGGNAKKPYAETITHFPWSQAVQNELPPVRTLVLSTKLGVLRAYSGALQTSGPNAFAGLVRPANVFATENVVYVLDQDSVKVFELTGQRRGSGKGFSGLVKPNSMAYGGPGGFLVGSESDNSIKAYNRGGAVVALQPGTFAGLSGPIAMTEASVGGPCR
jgi:hypothetical protein